MNAISTQKKYNPRLVGKEAVEYATEHGATLYAFDYNVHPTGEPRGRVVCIDAAEQMIAEGIESGVWCFCDGKGEE